MTQCDFYSTVTLPETAKPYPSVPDFLLMRFPFVPRGVWETRIAAGRVLDWKRRPVSAATEYVPGRKIYYRREVDDEPVIPFTEKVIFRSDEILVACKPHFLPVVPAGPYVNECLLHRLKKKTGNCDLVPLHRIDRETAGIVLFSANPATRGLYHDLFRQGQVEKIYQAVAECAVAPVLRSWTVENRLVTGEPWFRMKVVSGQANSRSGIELLEWKNNRGRFLLRPETGKKHQLRLHMSGLGFRIMHDRYYPDLRPAGKDDFNRPLQLLAATIRFRDPVTGSNMEFCTERGLQWD